MNKFRYEIKYINLLLAILFFLCFTSTACISVKPIYYDDDKKVAEKHVEKFHQLLNEEKYDEIYNLFNKKMQTAQSKEQFTKALQNILAVNGKVKNSKLIKSEVKLVESVRLVHMFYETEFEKETRLEEFDCLVDGENAIFDFYGHPEQMPGNLQ